MPIRVPTESRTEEVFPAEMGGSIEFHDVESDALRDNPWGDPHVRTVTVYLPPSGRTEGTPLLLLLSGFTGAGWNHAERPLYLRSTRIRRLDALIRAGRVPEAVLVAPDCLTSLGGSQYLNSTATGRYEDHVMDEVLPWVESRYRTGPVAALGTSSGGYGSLVLAMRHPDRIRAAASNAGDAYFEYCYLPEFPGIFRTLRGSGGPEAHLRRLLGTPTPGFGPRNPDVQALEMMAYASCYSPVESDPGTFELPFDLETGEIRSEVWARWLAWDPVRMVQREPYRDAARRLAYIYVDGGAADEYGLDVGARIFAGAARRGGVAVDFENFPGSHFDSVPRYDVMVPRLLRAIVPERSA